MPTTTTNYSIKYDRTDSGLNGAVDLGNSPNHIAMVRNKGGLLEIFFAGTDNALYHIRQVNGSVWEGLGNFAGSTAQQVAAASDANDLLVLFYIGTDGHLYIRQQLSPDQNDWSAGEILSGASAKSVTAAKNTDGRIEVFYVGTNSDLYHNWQTSPGGGQWAGETRLAGASAKQVAVASNADGRLEAFYVGTNNDLYHTAQVTALSAASGLPNSSCPGPARIRWRWLETRMARYTSSTLGPTSKSLTTYKLLRTALLGQARLSSPAASVVPVKSVIPARSYSARTKAARWNSSTSPPVPRCTTTSRRVRTVLGSARGESRIRISSRKSALLTMRMAA
jgi:hypothetical protein